MADIENTATGWLLKAAENIQFCIGLHQAAEYIESPVLHTIPLAPAYCTQVMFWRDAIIPVIDMNLLAGITPVQTSQYAMVIAYQTKDNTPVEHIAFIIESTPHKIQVHDDSICELPDAYPELLKPYVMSLFKHDNKVASIFNIAQLSLINKKRA